MTPEHFVEDKVRITLLLPSAVQPPSNMPFLTLHDSEIRLKQTIQALRYWAKFQSDERFRLRVVIGDNTGYSEVIKSKAGRYFESGVLQCLEVPKPSQELIALGKGAAETAALKFMIMNLYFEPSEFVAKMTARQICLNAFDLFNNEIKMGNFSAWPRPDLASIDSRFFYAKPEFLMTLMDPILESTDDLQGIFVEQLYADFGLWANRTGFRMFSHEPAIQGQAGTTGTKISRFTEAAVIADVTKVRKSLVRGFRRVTSR